MAMVTQGSARTLPPETTHPSAAWCELTDADTSDAIVAALAHGGVEVVFFTSASEMVFVQEAIAKARAFGRPAPRLVTVTHEHANLCAALGYAAVSGKPVATAVHVDAGTLCTPACQC